MTAYPTTVALAPGERLAVIGDVGGHPDVLGDELRRLGVDPDSGRLPPDLTVVQVGDLIHRGPDSARVITMVDRFLNDPQSRWIQLVGNHEAYYVDRELFDWSERLDRDSVATLKGWWREGTMQAAIACEARGMEYLITHAGLTAGFWREELGMPSAAADAADGLNALIHTRRSPLHRPGSVLSGGSPRLDAGPLWASAGHELIPSWLTDPPMPFNQVHGHSSLFDWQARRYRCAAQVQDITQINEFAKHETSRVGEGFIVGVDPGHDRSAQPPWRAFELAG